MVVDKFAFSDFYLSIDSKITDSGLVEGLALWENEWKIEGAGG